MQLSLSLCPSLFLNPQSITQEVEKQTGEMLKVTFRAQMFQSLSSIWLHVYNLEWRFVVSGARGVNAVKPVINYDQLLESLPVVTLH